MAHFAKLDKNNVVIDVCVVSNKDILDKDGKENEQIGIELLKETTEHIKWLQTSYNGNFRKNYAGIGYTYDEKRDAFIAPKTDDTEWVFNEETCQWERPIPYPDDDGNYFWVDGEWVKAPY